MARRPKCACIEGNSPEIIIMGPATAPKWASKRHKRAQSRRQPPFGLVDRGVQLAVADEFRERTRH